MLRECNGTCSICDVSKAREFDINKMFIKLLRPREVSHVLGTH